MEFINGDRKFLVNKSWPIVAYATKENKIDADPIARRQAPLHRQNGFFIEPESRQTKTNKRPTDGESTGKTTVHLAK